MLRFALLFLCRCRKTEETPFRTKTRYITLRLFQRVKCQPQSRKGRAPGREGHETFNRLSGEFTAGGSVTGRVLLPFLLSCETGVLDGKKGTKLKLDIDRGDLFSPGNVCNHSSFCFQVKVGDTLDLLIGEDKETGTAVVMRVVLKKVSDKTESEKYKVILRRWKNLKVPKQDVLK